jgi:hypothetical protein
MKNKIQTTTHIPFQEKINNPINQELREIVGLLDREGRLILAAKLEAWATELRASARLWNELTPIHLN